MYGKRLDEDPKMLWAQSPPDLFPVEVNEASLKDLMRVPGIGKKSAQRIIENRRRGVKFTEMDELKKIGVVVKRAEPFLQLNHTRQTTLSF